MGRYEWHAAAGRAVAIGALLALGATSATLADGGSPDLNGDCVVDGSDLGIILANWGGGGPGDIDRDGTIDGADLGALLAAWGELNPAQCVEIAKVFPPAGEPGEIVMLVGQFPDEDFGNWCVGAVPLEGGLEAGFIAFDVLAIEDGVMMAQVQPFPPQIAGPAQIMVGYGDGQFPPASPLFEFIVVLDRTIWSWEALGPGVMTDAMFDAQGGAAANDSNFYATLVNGDLKVTLDSPTGFFPAGTKFTIRPRAHHYADPATSRPYVGYDCGPFTIQTTITLSESLAANVICAHVQAAYINHNPPILIDCTSAPMGTAVELTLSLPGLSIDWGVFDITVDRP